MYRQVDFHLRYSSSVSSEVWFLSNNDACIEAFKQYNTRMHSSRMRTVGCSDRLLGEGCLPGGVFAHGGCLSDTPSVNIMTDAYENVADGNKKVWEGNVFTPVCHSVQSGWRGVSRKTPPGQRPSVLIFRGDHRSGRYASYLNAFLLISGSGRLRM